MGGFRLDVDEVREMRRQADVLAERGGLAARARPVPSRPGGLGAVDAAALFVARNVSTAELVELATRARAVGSRRLETFSPLYLTNECDAACRMCGMREDNAALVRETAEPAAVEGQLAILHRRGLRGVAILTGEYRPGPRRSAMIRRARHAVRAALACGFRHVLINIGSLDRAEYALLLEGHARDSAGTVTAQLTMCTFQETYDPACYERFMGRDPGNPRANYERRLGNFDRARDAGMWAANPGVLLGLNPDIAFEVIALTQHVRHLATRGMRVYVSLPRLRRATGTARAGGVDDDELVRIVAVLALAVPEARIVISTREPADVQVRLLPMIDVLTPGSPGVAPYTDTGARFALEASQFEVLDHRPIEGILGDVIAAGYAIDCYEPPARP